MENTLAGSVKPVTVIKAQAISGSKTGQTIDSKGFESLTLIVSLGDVAADVTLDVKESDSNSGPFTDVSADDLFGSFKVFGTTDGGSQHWVGYFGKKRFVRVNVVSGDADIGIMGLLGHPEQAPTLGPNADVQFANYG